MKKSTLLLVSIGFGILTGGLLALAFPSGAWLRSWLAYGAVCVPACAALVLAWRGLGAGRGLAWMLVLAFGLRVVFGAALQALLPLHGNGSEPELHGYLFYDAYARDQAAWNLAQSGQSLAAAFDGEYADDDQYGGLLALSALVYRALSSDAERPLLTVMLGAFIYALGLPFLVAAIRTRWGEFSAAVAGWIYALYPQSLLLGASQMREPFLMGALALATWAVVRLTGKKWIAIGVLAALLAGAAMISWRIALAGSGVLLAWLVLEQAKRLGPRLQRWGWLALILAGVVIVFASWEWLTASGAWDIKLLQAGSGMVDKRLDELPEVLRLPFILAYGVAQPVLPAAVADATIPLRQTISILWAIGWYALAPLLLFALFAVWRAQPPAERLVLAWLALAALLWTLISALRGGADQWDNPRYRTIFLPWMGLLAGWAWQRAREQRTPWLGRVYALALVFIGGFTLWYLGRYAHWFGGLPFWSVVVGVMALGAAIIAVGWWRDRSLTHRREKL